MKLYAGIDLHSNNSYLAITDSTTKVLYQKRLANDAEIILKELNAYRENLVGIAVESTYNWYWLVDQLTEAHYPVHLANTTGMQQYSGLKHSNDKTDAIWLSTMLQLGVLPEGHIYPKEKRGLRELLRRRLVLVRQQTMCVLGVQSMVTRYENIKVCGNKIKNKKNLSEILSYIEDEDVSMAAESQLKVLHSIVEQVAFLEKEILKRVEKSSDFQLLQMIPGIGPVLAITILLETGDIKRFKHAGNYSSYCRCVESKRVSNGKKKGENNRKNGNAYLSWAFMEAANNAVRYSESLKKYYQRKLAKTKRVIALKTIANKLSKAIYFVLRDKVEFDMQKLIS